MPGRLYCSCSSSRTTWRVDVTALVGDFWREIAPAAVVMAWVSCQAVRIVTEEFMRCWAWAAIFAHFRSSAMRWVVLRDRSSLVGMVGSGPRDSLCDGQNSEHS